MAPSLNKESNVSVGQGVIFHSCLSYYLLPKEESDRLIQTAKRMICEMIMFIFICVVCTADH